MKIRYISAGLAAAAALAIAGAGVAVADDYTALLTDPNQVTDTLAYTPGAPTMNPAGQPGASIVWNHRDGRTITDTVWVLADPAAATAAITAAQSASGIANPKIAQVPVGNGGTWVTGTNGAQSLSVLYFTQGNAAASIAFAGPIGDPVPSEIALELGQSQAALIKSRMGG
jgi:hypothetical protein